MMQQLDMFAGCNLVEFLKIPGASFIGIDNAYGKSIREFFLHDLGNLVASLLMIASAGTHKGFYKICIYVTLRDYEIGPLIHLFRYASML